MRKIVVGFIASFLFLQCSTVEKAVYIEEGDRRFEALPSTYRPLRVLGNVHSLNDDKTVIRGANPTGRGEALKANGITDILIFRQEKQGDVAAQIEELKSLGYEESQIHHIPFEWDKNESFSVVCDQIVEGLNFLFGAQSSKGERKVYFHCTVGEDRTGLLAALFRMLEDGWALERAFFDEMCAHGFAEANPRKPSDVAERISRNLKPNFFVMAKLIEEGSLSKDNLNEEVCSVDPKDFLDVSSEEYQRLVCEKLSLAIAAPL